MSWSHQDYKDAGWYRITVRVPKALKDHLQKHTHAPLWQVLWKHFLPTTTPPSATPPPKGPRRP